MVYTSTASSQPGSSVRGLLPDFSVPCNDWINSYSAMCAPYSTRLSVEDACFADKSAEKWYNSISFLLVGFPSAIDKHPTNWPLSCLFLETLYYYAFQIASKKESTVQCRLQISICDLCRTPGQHIHRMYPIGRERRSRMPGQCMPKTRITSGYCLLNIIKFCDFNLFLICL